MKQPATLNRRAFLGAAAASRVGRHPINAAPGLVVDAAFAGGTQSL